MIQRTIL